MRIITWNLCRATESSACWRLIRELDPDLALFQEVVSISPAILERYEVAAGVGASKRGVPQKFKTVILAKGRIERELELTSIHDWVNEERRWFGGCIVGRKVVLNAAGPLNVVCSHSPAWPVDRSRLAGVDDSNVRLKNNPDVWCTEIVWSMLRNSMPIEPGRWVVGGDFNSSETFDAWRVGGRGNREIIDRFNSLGLFECLRTHHGRLVPTFRNPRGGKIVHQIDHLYVSDPLLGTLRACDVGREGAFMGPDLSDHLPIVADFEP